ncbi:MAG: hypothetical protein RJA19_13 [Bacteroidota bacterium]
MHGVILHLEMPPRMNEKPSSPASRKPSSSRAGGGSLKARQMRMRKRVFWIGISPILGFIGLVLLASLRNLPDTEALANPRTDLATRVFSADGKIIGRYYAENRSDARFDELPQHLIDALVCTEDARFYEHSGVDFIGLARAVFFLGTRGGGSTVTQQLAKLLFTESYDQTNLIERALLQKPKEWIIAAQLERYYTKGEILALYLNRYDFLNQAVGIKSAANVYFDKDVKDLNVQESAMLVGMLKNSSLYNPLRREELVLSRRETVMSQMVRYGKLDEATFDSLRTLPLGLDYQPVSHDEGTAPYFREILRAELRDLLQAKNEDGTFKIAKADGTPYDLYRDGLQIFTTIDSRLQKAAEEAVHAHLANELQAAFEKDLKKRPKEDFPFYRGIDPAVRDGILKESIEGSERYQQRVGKVCPECGRPAFYIVSTTEDGVPMWTCDEDKGGCSHTWHRPTEKEIETEFNTPVAMRVFSHAGPLDTTMSPLDSIKYHKAVLHAGLMSVEPATGHIKAWVGGIDYRFFKYDNVGQSRRQVGSVFKPFVYATALKLGMRRCSEIPNQKICLDMPEGYPDWCPDNSDFAYGDIVTLEYALANSMNTVTAKLIKDFGTERVIQLAHDMGIENEIPNYPSIALGAAQLTLREMTVANASFVNGGVFVSPTFIARIEDKLGNVIYTPKTVIRQGLDERTAYTVLQMMKGVVDGAYSIETGNRKGTAMRIRGDRADREYDGIRAPMAGKTGTTQNNTDGWFIGLTPDLVTGVWVGAQDPTVRFSTTTLGQGANTGLPIYGYYMKAVYANEEVGLSRRDFDRPRVLGPDSLECSKVIRELRPRDASGPGEEELEELFGD